ncbi:MAG: TonB-dependent receptor [Tannerella sp.]|nr:TonB-dependent receptor [Tannerella sp.]
MTLSLMATEVAYAVNGNTSSVKESDPAQTGRTVKCVVSDELGPVAGANITIKGTTIGDITNENGEATLKNVPAGAVIVVSYIGYATQEVPVNNKDVLEIILEEDVQKLEEVVAIGYGVAKKVNLTGAVTTIDAGKLEARPAPSLSASLAGLASGVNVLQSSGKPGSENVSFTIRGTGSFNGSSPMFVIDGIPIAGSDGVSIMNAINPDDVESVTFLKDAASSAIYGSRGANGVVMITTKSGKKDAKPSITYTGVFANEKAISNWRLLSDMPTWMELHNRTQLNNAPDVASLWYTQDVIDAWVYANAHPNEIYHDELTGTEIPNHIAYPNTDWAQIMFQPTFYQKHTLSVSGGSKTSNYLLSLGYQDNPGTLENTAQQRYNVRANIESKISDIITLGTQTFATKYYGEPGSVSMTYLFQAYPGINPKYKGEYGAGEDPQMTSMNNVLQSVAAAGGQNETTRINTSWYMALDLMEGLNVKTTFNWRDYFNEAATWSQDIPRKRFRTGDYENIGNLAEATTYRYMGRSSDYLLNVVANYSNKFGEHSISAMAGYEQAYSSSKAFSAQRKGLIDWGITDLTSATQGEGEVTGGSTLTDFAIISFFGRVNYDYKGKYLLEADLRRDASSKFAPDHRWGTFGGASLAWRISEEDFFLPLKDYVNNFKLRASYGVLGNTVSGNYDWQALYSKVNVVMDESVALGIVASQLSNPYLSWESVATTDFGFDASFLNNRLGIEFDWYNRATSGILTQPPIYHTLGTMGAPMSNTADMSNKGVDFTLNWRDKIGEVRYGISFNAGYNTNLVTKYKGKLKFEADPKVLDAWGNPTYRYTNFADVSNNSTSAVVEGHLYQEYYYNTPYSGSGKYLKGDGSIDPNGGPKDGIIRTKADLEWVKSMLAAGYSFNNQTVGPTGQHLWYGEMICADNNGDGKYGNSDDRKFSGKSSRPKWTFGSTINGEYKGIDISMTWAGRLGSYHYISERGAGASGLTQNTDALAANALSLHYWYDPVKAFNDYDNYDPATDPNANVNAKYPRIIVGGATTPANTFYLYNTSFLRLKTLSIGYALPKKWLSPAKISNLRLFFAGENLLTFMNERFLAVDPEQGGSLQVYPIAKMISGGLSITF